MKQTNQFSAETTNYSITNPAKFHSYDCLASRIEEQRDHTLVFNVEETLLKSCSWFPFFMLVAFEGGGLLRALVLLLFYPLLCLVNESWRLKIMVFICFFGIKRSTFRIGTTVLPKFFLEDVGYEGFEVVMRFGKRLGVTNFPKVMVEGFLREYLGIEGVFGRELKVFGGYYLGWLEDKEVTNEVLNEHFREANMKSLVIGMVGLGKTIDKHLFPNCKDIYWVNEADKQKWRYLPRDNYPKPLIFHDGRLAILPTPFASLTMFIWLPFGLVLCITRIAIAQFLPYKLSIPILAVLGLSGARSQKDLASSSNSRGLVYVCNHKTLLDPVSISFLLGVQLTTVTYSISKLSKIIAPIKTVTLTRNRERDAEIMSKMLSKENVVVCPEGTTCREPYLLRFSPLFAEISDEIVPVAIDVKVSMFYGTTASGTKALDPIFFLLNPYPYYFTNFLEKLPKSHTCGIGGMSKIDVANYVQAEIAKALEYKCTSLTRKEKYTLLAGNTGVLIRG